VSVANRMTNTPESVRRQPQVASSNQEKTKSGNQNKESNYEMTTGEGVPSQNWPTPKESMTMTTAMKSSKVPEGSKGVNEQLYPLITMEIQKKKDKPSYPIFHRQGKGAMRSKLNPNNALTMVPAPTPTAPVGGSAPEASVPTLALVAGNWHSKLMKEAGGGPNDGTSSKGSLKLPVPDKGEM
jgi:hypothetical protein